MMKSLFLVLILVIASTAVAFAQSGDVVVDAVDENAVTVNIVPASSTSTGWVSKPIRRSLDLNPLTDIDRKAIDEQLKKHHDKKDDGNNQAFRNGLTLFRQMDVIHLSKGKLHDRPPNDVHFAYQVFTQGRALEKLSYDLPVFNRGGPQGQLVLDAVPAVERSRAVAYVAQGQGALVVSHPGSTSEVPVASGFRSWKDIPRSIEPVKPPPPPPDGPTCDPNGDPPAKPPTNGPVGDPSWIEPNQDLPPGYVAPGGPPPPTGDQAPVVIGPPGNPPDWAPPLTHPNVADPVDPATY